MIISYSQRASVHEANSQTFDGNHPCAFCKAIKKGRAEEQHQNGQQLILCPFQL